MTQFSLRYRSAYQAALIALATTLLTGCATTAPDPTIAVAAAEQAIAAADRTRIADAASPELSEARDKLSAAKAAAQQERNVEAERLALESRADAELAAARSDASKAQAVNDEMKRSMESLTQEMQRNSGATR